MNLKSLAVYHSGGSLPSMATALPATFFWQPNNSSLPLLIGYFEDQAGEEYIMVVNKNTGSGQTAAFTISTGYSNVKEVSKANGQLVDTNYQSGTGQISVSFLPGEGKLFKLQQ